MKNKKIALVSVSNHVHEVFTKKIEADCNVTVESLIGISDLLNHTSKLDIDLIVLDFDGGHSGEVTNQMEKLIILRRCLPNIPLIVISSNTKMSRAVDIINYGAVDFIDLTERSALSSLVSTINETLDYNEGIVEYQMTQKTRRNEYWQLYVLLSMIIAINLTILFW
ncbi:MAG: hypothetical protein MI810_24455 [Flavobacteriales bacterium]|nr:hypothetical protein [Flavobacteriales bacterium]